jgi:hypothetical protein
MEDSLMAFRMFAVMALCASGVAMGCSGSSSGGDSGCSDTVITPGGPIPRECVHEVPNGGDVILGADGGASVTVDGAVVATYPACPCGPLMIGPPVPPQQDQ